MPVDPETWAALWSAICELSELFPDGLVFIGGIAVYLHARQARLAPWGIEFSHDGDFYVSLTDFSDLRDVEEVTANRRLSKHQFIKNGLSFDVYLEYNNTLRVPYADALSRSLIIDNVRVASLEHLLLLKLDAYADRKGSAKGQKDERDLIRITHILSHQVVHKRWLEPYATAEDVRLLTEALRSPEFVSMTRNVKQAGALRTDFRTVLNAVREIVEKNR
jgi:hypothetical protein